MSASFMDPALSAALWIVVKASVLLVAAAAAHRLLRPASAEMRHFVLTAAVIALLLLPLLSRALPDWPLVIPTTGAQSQHARVASAVEHAGTSRRSAPSESVATSTDNPVVAHPAGVSVTTVALGLYVSGLLVMSMLLVWNWRNARRIVRGAAYLQSPDWTRLATDCARSLGVRRAVRLLRSSECGMPMAWGTWRPAVLIPAVAGTWPGNRRRAVILHELAHVARYDCLTQMLAYVARAMFWFHPGAWWLARQMRIERELACDDRVIVAGTHGRDYASDLLEIAYMAGNQPRPALAVSMARPCQLESRMLAALDASRNRRVPAWRIRLTGAAIAAASLASLAAARPTTLPADLELDGIPRIETAEAVPGSAFAPASKPPGKTSSAPAGRTAVSAAATGTAGAREDLPGTWEIRPTGKEGTVHLRLVEANSSSGSNMEIERLEGLTAAQLAGAAGPVQFRLRRDAGTFTFEGVVRNGVGAGTFSFTPEPKFPADLAARGFARPTADEQYQLARHDIGYAFVDELSKQGYSKSTTGELVRAGQHGVQATYLRDMGALGYRLGSLGPLIELRDHGVTPDYIRALADQGYKGLSADELRRARDHGITPEYVRAMREEGYASVPMDELIKTRDHGVTPEFVRELGAAGHGKMPLAQLIRVRDHGVTPEYVRDMRQFGYALPIDELVRARDHGVTQEYVRGMREAGHTALTMEQLITARDHGVSVEFVRGMAAAGHTSLSIESTVRLRDHGVTPEYVKELKGMGYDSLTIDDLVTLRSHGLTPDRIRAANARAGTRLPIERLKSGSIQP